ncbi:MAG TPA: dihydroxyacetone kinase phosphoryl donor subunit DhaM [Actinophytocola sp.]|nr:dihydroxyacetone kinase phosphoryl donor subunit DhaM [Actinophytocola sp.]
MTRVGLVVVSHSARLAAGVAEVAGQMAPDVTVAAAGGTAEGGVGTDFDAVTEALAQADAGAGVVVLYDLGSARMVAELAVESLDDPSTAVLVDAPLVEGAVAAAVAAQGGADLVAVASAARDAGSEPEAPAPAAGAEIRVRLTNEIGLHARPAALTARTLSELDASVTVRFGDRSADATSVLALMALGARGGDEVTVSAAGRQADEALRAFADLADRDFAE